MKTKKRNFKRLLLLISLLVVTFGLTGCTKATDVSKMEITYNGQTITVSSPADNAFVLDIELEKNGEKYSCTSEKLYVAKNIPQSYELKDLVGGYISDDCVISSVSANSANVADWGGWLIIAFLVGLLVGAFIMLFNN